MAKLEFDELMSVGIASCQIALVSHRRATINQIRAFLIEQGIAVRKGLRALKNSF
jgi:hypothetical protein